MTSAFTQCDLICKLCRALIPLPVMEEEGGTTAHKSNRVSNRFHLLDCSIVFVLNIYTCFRLLFTFQPINIVKL